MKSALPFLLLTLSLSTLYSVSYTENTPFLSPMEQEEKPIVSPMQINRPAIHPMQISKPVIHPIQNNELPLPAIEKKKKIDALAVKEHDSTNGSESIEPQEEHPQEEIKVETESTNFFNTLNNENKDPVNMEQ